MIELIADELQRLKRQVYIITIDNLKIGKSFNNAYFFI